MSDARSGAGPGLAPCVKRHGALKQVARSINGTDEALHFCRLGLVPV